MAKVKLLPSDVSERALTYYGKRPSFKGAVVYYLTKSGLAAMVRPYSVPGRTERQRMVWEWMRYTNLAWKVTDPLLVSQYHEQSKGLWILPRDIFFAAQAGRLLAFDDADTGFSYFPVRHRDDMSRALDVFIQTPGGLLYRSPVGWAGLPAGEPGQVLMVSAEGLPVWSSVPPYTGAHRHQVFVEAALYGYLQATSSTSLADGRRALVLSGSATSTAYFGSGFPLPTSFVSYSVSIAKTSTSGGDTRMGIVFRLYSRGGDVIWGFTENKTVPFPAADSNQIFSGSVGVPGDIFSPGELYSYSLRVIRFGGDPLDVASFNTFLWRVDVSFV